MPCSSGRGPGPPILGLAHATAPIVNRDQKPPDPGAPALWGPVSAPISASLAHPEQRRSHHRRPAGTAELGIGPLEPDRITTISTPSRLVPPGDGSGRAAPVVEHNRACAVGSAAHARRRSAIQPGKRRPPRPADEPAEAPRHVGIAADRRRSHPLRASSTPGGASQVSRRPIPRKRACRPRARRPAKANPSAAHRVRAGRRVDGGALGAAVAPGLAPVGSAAEQSCILCRTLRRTSASPCRGPPLLCTPPRASPRAPPRSSRSRPLGAKGTKSTPRSGGADRAARKPPRARASARPRPIRIRRPFGSYMPSSSGRAGYRRACRSHSVAPPPAGRPSARPAPAAPPARRWRSGHVDQELLVSVRCG